MGVGDRNWGENITPIVNPFQAKDASRQPWPGARDASRQYF